jgi:FixJ family two-component response regulator
MNGAVPLVYVVDDDAAVRDALSMLLAGAGFEVVACENGDAFLGRYDPARPCCLLLDVCMPGTGGLELQSHLAGHECPPPIIFLTGHADVPTAVTALKQGAVDFFEKPLSDHDGLIRRVEEAIAQHRRRLDEEGRRAAARARLEQLTPREREVFDRICAGQPNKVVAIELGISERTVELHRSRLMRKLNVRSVAELVRMRTAGDEP